MKHLVILSLVLALSTAANAENQAAGGGAATGVPSVDPEAGWARKQCEKEPGITPEQMADCEEWRNRSKDADKMWAEKACGGTPAYNKNAKKFESCVDGESEKLGTGRTKGEEACGGFKSYKEDDGKFRSCLAEKWKNMDHHFAPCTEDDPTCIPKTKKECLKRGMKWKKNACDRGNVPMPMRSPSPRPGG